MSGAGRRRTAAVDVSAVEAQVERIAKMNKAELKALWRAVGKTEPPTAFGPDLLRRSLAYKVQEQAFGGLDAATRRALTAVTVQIRKRPFAHIELPRRIKSGAVLMREWKGKVHRVTVVENRFLHDGQTYSSLSEVATLITGTRWNGPRFFGLRPTEAQKRGLGAHVSPARLPRGRPRKSPLNHPQADEGIHP